MKLVKRCILCSSHNLSKIKNVNSKYDLVKCKNCNLIALNPQPTFEELKKFYEHDLLNNFEYYRRSIKYDEKTFSERLILAERFAKTGMVLDIGCGTGTFMKVARSRGWKPSGVEWNKKSAEFCRKKLKLKVYSEIPAESRFNLVNMSDVIEHLTNPKKELLRIKKLLNEGGILMISTPDYDKFGTKLFQVKPNEHLFYFTNETLKKILNATGFSILYMKNVSRYQSLNSLQHSSTFKDKKIKFIIEFLIISRISKLIEPAILKMLHSDIFVLAKRV